MDDSVDLSVEDVVALTPASKETSAALDISLAPLSPIIIAYLLNSPYPNMVEQTGEREKGTIKWFEHRKRYRFITPKSGGEDIIVHKKVIKTDSPVGPTLAWNNSSVERLPELGRERDCDFYHCKARQPTRTAGD